jgi:DNA-binding PadR family transcriptional regulator
MPGRAITDLEAFALGLIWRHGPCTPYAVRRFMADSPSTQWSGSAGAIYPLVRRLERQGLLKSSAEANDGRKARAYTMTAKGLAALRRWIGPPLSADAITVAYDPLRSRARFLSVLPLADQRAWITSAQNAMTEVANRVRRWQELYGTDDPLAGAMTRSGELDVESRTMWLSDLAAAIGTESGHQPGRKSTRRT